MATLCEIANVSQRLDKLDLCTAVNTDLDWLEGDEHEKYITAGLRAVECEDGRGNKLPLYDADGLLMSRNIPTDILSRFDNFPARDDDILLATYPKSGTHWMWEIVSMLKKGSSSLLSETIQHVDYLPMNMLTALPSPRVLATHMPFSRIPREFVSRDCKMIWVVRNPWDVAVSFHHFIQKLSVFEYAGDWDGFFDLFLEGNVPYNSWFEHTQDWMKGMETTSNILLVRYEDLHQNFKKEVQRIADYLNVPVTDAMLETMQRETSFANMSRNKFDFTVQISKDGTSPIFRKGECGDWRNWFTEQQSAELRGAYRVSLGHHHTTLEYTNDRTIWG